MWRPWVRTQGKKEKGSEDVCFLTIYHPREDRDLVCVFISRSSAPSTVCSPEQAFMPYMLHEWFDTEHQAECWGYHEEWERPDLCPHGTFFWVARLSLCKQQIDKMVSESASERKGWCGVRRSGAKSFDQGVQGWPLGGRGVCAESWMMRRLLTVSA